MDEPVFKLQSVKKQDIASETRVINADEFEYYLWVRVPEDIMRQFVLTDLRECGETLHPVCILAAAMYAGGPWYRIESQFLNRTAGYHIYRMQMANVVTDNVVSVFFAYIVQDDSPDKPYKYMDGNDVTRCCCNVSSEYRVS